MPSVIAASALITGESKVMTMFTVALCLGSVVGFVATNDNVRSKVRRHHAPCAKQHSPRRGRSRQSPIRAPVPSPNHMLPSGPAVMLMGFALAVMPALYSLTTPPGVIRQWHCRCSP